MSSALVLDPPRTQPTSATLAGAIEAELAVDVRELDPDELGERRLRLRAEHDRLTVAIARTDAEFDRSRSFARLDDSCTSAAQWLAARTKAPLAVTRDAIRLARRLSILPLVEAAILAGTITVWAAAAVTKAATRPGRAAAIVADQAWFVDQASQLAGRELQRRVRRWLEDRFPAEAESDAERVEARRSVETYERADGSSGLSVKLERVMGSAVTTLLGRIEREFFEADWAEAKEVHGDHTRLEHLARTSAQRRHDALVEMAFRAEAARPGAAARRPLVTIIAGAGGLRDRICELEDGTFVTRNQALRVLTVGDFERALHRPDDRIAVSERARLFTGAERRAIELRDRLCTVDGCEVCADRCEVDHITRYEHGGLTVQGNGRLRCHDHHEGRSTPLERRPNPWEYADGEWDEIEAGRLPDRR